MAGLDNLLQEIQKLANAEAEQILRSGEDEAAKIKEDGRVEAELRSKEVSAKADAEVKGIVERGASGMRLRRRNELLALKQELIRDMTAKAKLRVIDMPDAEYFKLLGGWASRSGISGNVAVCLNERDLARDMGSFLDSFPKAAGAVLSEAPADISGGFLAVSGGVTVNCSIDAVFEIHADAIHRELRRILFDQERGDEK